MSAKPFRKGLEAGFTSPFTFFMPHTIKAPAPATIESAWREVATFIEKASREEINKYEEKETPQSGTEI